MYNVMKFHQAAMSAKKEVLSTWDEYIDALNRLNDLLWEHYSQAENDWGQEDFELIKASKMEDLDGFVDHDGVKYWIEKKVTPADIEDEEDDIFPPVRHFARHDSNGWSVISLTELVVLCSGLTEDEARSELKKLDKIKEEKK